MVFTTVARLDRVFLEIGPITIYWYGVIIAIAVGMGFWLAIKETQRLGLERDLIVDFVVYAVPIAIVSARIYYVIFEWESYSNGPFWRLFAVWEGGIAIHGAILGGVLTAIVFSRMKNISFWQLADILAPSLILGQAIGRWGNFMNQEAHGRELLDGTLMYDILPEFIISQMTINDVTYHPTFLYESIWNVVIFVLLLLIRNFNPLRGELFLTYLMGYSFGRFFIEGMRTDSLYVVGDLRTAQIVSILLIIGSIIYMVYRRKITKVRYSEIRLPVQKKSNRK